MDNCIKKMKQIIIKLYICSFKDELFCCPLKVSI